MLFRSVSIEPRLEHETIVEIEPLVPQFVSKYFGDHNFKVAENPKVTIRIDDGRHFLMTTDQKFDGITSDRPPGVGRNTGAATDLAAVNALLSPASVALPPEGTQDAAPSLDGQR